MEAKISGLLLIVSGILLGLVIGLMVLFATGVDDIIKYMLVGGESYQLHRGLIKIFFAVLVEWTAAFVLIIPGINTIKQSIKNSD